MENKRQEIEKLRGEKLDQHVNKSINILNLSTPPMSSWNKAGTWEIIKNKIHSSNKTMIVWGFSMAASISLLIASVASIDPQFFEDTVLDEKSVVEIKANRTSKEVQSINIPKKPGKLVKLSAKTSMNVIEAPEFRPYVQNIILDNKSTQTFENKISLVNPYFAIQHSAYNGTNASIGLDINLYTKVKKFQTHQVTLGTSLDFRQTNTESGSSIHPFSYINVGYSISNNNNHKGWNAMAGYMINPDSNTYKNTTVKLSIGRKLSKHLRVGPEFIFTNNFKKVYPGVSIILS
ncbi:MAG: hypothetical protein JXQ96_22280 [Cyclobacteriaceae bacterium]